MHPSVLIIGVGNEYRRDDGAGIAVARRLQGQAPAAVSVLGQGAVGTALLEAWAEYPVVFLVDAVDCSAPPGRFFRLEAHRARLPSRCFPGSTHACGVAEAVELARALNQLPGWLVVYGIQGKDFNPGKGLSAEVEAGVARVIHRILGELRQCDFGQ